MSSRPWRFKLEKVFSEQGVAKVSYSLVVSDEDVPELVAALAKRGRAPTGYAIEALLIHLSEEGEPEWAQHLAFDSEASRCVVRCALSAPLKRLAERLSRMLASRGATWRAVQALLLE